MTIILRLPAILVLFAAVLLAWAGAAAGAAVLLDLPVPVPGLERDTVGVMAQSTWLDVGLWFAAGLFFLIAAVRLIRRTQGFWLWLLGFACYGGRWAWAQQGGGGDLLGTVKQIDPNLYLKPGELIGDTQSTETQLGLLGVLLILGLVILVIDAADRAHWNRHEG